MGRWFDRYVVSLSAWREASIGPHRALALGKAEADRQGHQKQQDPAHFRLTLITGRHLKGV